MIRFFEEIILGLQLLLCSAAIEPSEACEQLNDQGLRQIETICDVSLIKQAKAMIRITINIL